MTLHQLKVARSIKSHQASLCRQAAATETIDYAEECSSKITDNRPSPTDQYIFLLYVQLQLYSNSSSLSLLLNFDYAVPATCHSTVAGACCRFLRSLARERRGSKYLAYHQWFGNQKWRVKRNEPQELHHCMRLKLL